MMRSDYTSPYAALLMLTAEEIRTDLLSASNGTGLTRDWNDFLTGDENG